MIEIQLRSLENVAAILAGVLIPLEDVMPGELHFLFRQPIKKEKHNHAWDPDLPRDRGDYFIVWRGGGEIAPTGKVVSQKIVGWI